MIILFYSTHAIYNAAKMIMLRVNDAQGKKNTPNDAYPATGAYTEKYCICYPKSKIHPIALRRISCQMPKRIYRTNHKIL